jgi:hypothetical protein
MLSPYLANRTISELWAFTKSASDFVRAGCSLYHQRNQCGIPLIDRFSPNYRFSSITDGFSGGNFRVSKTALICVFRVKIAFPLSNNQCDFGKSPTEKYSPKCEMHEV